VISKNIYIPKLSSSEELQLMVENEFSKIIPEEINLNDLAIDYMYTGEEESEEFAEVLVVASKKEKVEFIQALVEGAGLNLEILDVEGFAIENLLKLMKGLQFYEGTYIFADCSASMLRMYAYVDGQLIATKDSQLGGHTLTMDLMNNLGVTFEEAEKLKQERSEDKMFLDIERNFLLNYKLEFFTLLAYFSSAHSLIKVDDIILSGGVAGHPNFEKMIIEGLLEEQSLMVLNEPYIAKPLENAKKSIPNIQKFNKDEQNLFLATSLAVRQYLRDY
jgi:type IV pilus assembly protein PilM